VPEPFDLDPALWKRRAPFAALLAALTLGAFFLGRCHPFGDSLPPESSSVVTVQPSPNVILAVRELARLETTDYHVERVIELADEQVHLFGLVRAKDALLLVAAGDVVAGVDLRKIGDADLVVDWPRRQVRVRLPAPEIFSVAIDNARTHVVTRTTDTLATRKEELEGHARSEAESSMRQAALEAGVLPRAKVAAERAIAELLRGLGFEKVTFEGSRGRIEGEETLAPAPQSDDASPSRSADE
jgi:hypothetical protein